MERETHVPTPEAIAEMITRLTDEDLKHDLVFVDTGTPEPRIVTGAEIAETGSLWLTTIPQAAVFNGPAGGR